MKHFFLKIILTLFFLPSLIAPLQAQNNSTKVLVDSILNLTNNLKKELRSLPIAEIQKRSYQIVSMIERGAAELDTIAAVRVAKLESFTYLLNLHGMKNQVDSVMYYKKKIETNGKGNFKLLGIAELYFSTSMIVQKNYIEGIEAYNKALNYFSKAGEKDLYARTLIQLGIFYLDTKNINLAYSTYEILEKELQVPEIDEKIKNKIFIFYARLLFADKKKEASLKAFKSVSKTLLKGDKLSSIYYYKSLSYSFLDNHKIDSALIYAKKAYRGEKIPAHFFHAKNQLFAAIYIAEKEYSIAQKYVDSSLSRLKASNMTAYADFYDLLSKIEKNKGNYKEAFFYAEKFNKITDSVLSVEVKNKSLILNYNLKKEKEFIRLDAINKSQDLLRKKDREFFYLIILLIILVISSIALFVFLYGKAKRKILLVELEQTKKTGAEKKKFLENLSHEIRTPITIIIGYLNLIKKNSLNTENVISYSEKTIDASAHMIDSLNNFLSLSKLEESMLKIKKVPKKMGLFVRDLVFSFEANAVIKKQSFYYKTNIKPDILVEFDYENLKKIIFNLISNAIKYTNTEKAIYVTSFIEGKDLVFSVKDEGIGIANKELEHIFSRFYQPEHNSEAGGFGIGLSLVQELVIRMNGSIQVESKENIGSLFTVSIPLEIEQKSLYISSLETAFECIHDHKTQKTSASENNLPKALIVDDNIKMISYLKDLLSHRLDCTFAYNGLNGLNACKKKQFDLIISDYKMPQMSGFEFKSKLNKLENYKDIPFMMITATPQIIGEGKRFRLGINDYILKPFANEEVFARINNLLENSSYRKKLHNIDNEVLDFKGAHSQLMDKVNAIVLDNIINETFNVKLLALECGFSQQHLGVILRSKTGLTPVKLILEIRLLKSYEYIVNHSYQTLNEVMYAVGLSSRTYFNKVFFKRFGVKPNDLMKKGTY